ncbi:MAG: hypothetical protein KAI75_00920 [Desulfobulbaceae bacterium]|nr:hypothetical protein [Desulfobulbaceae bacterium]
MKELWSNDYNKIYKELATLIEKRTPLIMSFPDSVTQQIRAKAIKKKETSSLLILYKVQEFNIGDHKTCLILYRPLEYLTRLFQVAIMKDGQKHLAVMFPNEISQISKRKFPRVTACGDSAAVFTVQGSTRLNSGQIKDISREGSLLTGAFGTAIKEGATIGPLSMTLYMKNDFAKELTIHVPQATVVKIFEIDSSTKGAAIHFQLEGEDHAALENYIDLRFVEESLS